MEYSRAYRVLTWVLLFGLAGCINSIAGPDEGEDGDTADDPTPPSAWIQPAGGASVFLA
jgi:hypothetical protein